MSRLWKILIWFMVGAWALFIAWIASPFPTEIILPLACPEPTQDCLVRYRAAGHVWSNRGDYEGAQKWYRLSADAGDPAAMFHLAWTYEQKGFASLKKAGVAWDNAFNEEKLSVRIRRFLTNLFSKEDMEAEIAAHTEDMQSNFAAASRWYEQAALKGFAPAMNNLGLLYANGLGVPKQDWNKAYEWSRKAADAGNPIGAMNAFIISANPDYKGAHPDSLSTTIDPGRSNAADLLYPTLERTELYGGLKEGEPYGLRQAAEENMPFEVTIRRPQVDASLPTFHRVPKQSFWPKW